VSNRLDKTDFDIVVVGAGPAGSAVARITAKAGLNVLLLEEHSEVGFPVQCSGFVTERTLDEVGFGAQTLIRNEIRGATVHAPGSTRVQLGGKETRAIALDRSALDQLLVSKAEQEGARVYLQTRLNDIQREDNRLRVRLKQAKTSGDICFTTRLVIGADGWNSSVRRWMQLPQIATIAAVSIDTTLQNDLNDMAQIFVGNQVAPGWFGWAIPLADGSNRIGIGCDPKHTNIKPRILLEQLLHLFPEQLTGAKMENFSGGFIPLYTNADHYRESISDNLMLVGDAAGQVKPTSGGGIYTGLRAAESAAKVAIMAMNDGDFSSNSLRRYEYKWRDNLEDEFERGGDVREMFLTLSDKQLQRVVQFLGLPGLRQIIDRYGDIDYQSHVFAQLVRVAPTLKSMLALPSILPDRWIKMLANNSKDSGEKETEFTVLSR
tara:strand:- start:659 stop:1960 length:1302 start_codon:yes stop_codon:yes gene_type:complete